MTDRTQRMWQAIGLLSASAFWVLASTIVAGGIISGFPRPMQGESPEGSKLLCLAVVWLVQLTVPVLFVLLATKSRRLRVAGFLAIGTAMLVEYGILDGLDLLDKAWRRGL